GQLLVTSDVTTLPPSRWRPALSARASTPPSSASTASRPRLATSRWAKSPSRRTLPTPWCFSPPASLDTLPVRRSTSTAPGTSAEASADGLADHDRWHARQEPPRERRDARILLALTHHLHADRKALDRHQRDGDRGGEQHRARGVEDEVAGRAR